MHIFNISNPGYKEVTLEGPHLRLSDGSTMFFLGLRSTIKFPYALAEGKVIHAWYPYDSLIKDLKNGGYKGEIKIEAAVNDRPENSLRISILLL